MAVITGSPALSNGKIGYKNLFTTSGVTVSASSEAAGYPKENAYDWLSYDFWKPTTTNSWIRASFTSAKTADYMAVFGHNLADVASTVKPQYSTDGGSTWIDAASAVGSTDNSTIFVTFDPIIAADWRVRIAGPAPTIAGVMIGEALTLETGFRAGFVVPSMNIQARHKTFMSEGGVFIGGSKISEGIAGKISINNLSPAWVRSDWIPFMEHARTPLPFIFAWESDSYLSETVFAYAKSGMVPAPSYQDVTYMKATLDIEGKL